MKQLTIISRALFLLIALQASCGIISSFPYTESFEVGYGEWSNGYSPYTNTSGSIAPDGNTTFRITFDPGMPLIPKKVV